MTDKRPKVIALDREDLTWEEVLAEVEKKRAYLESADRYYKGNDPITQSVVVQQEEYKEKLLVIDEIKFSEDNYQYRYGYWVVSDEKLAEGEIAVVFGQFASVIPPEDLQRLHEKAEAVEWSGPGPV